jgi:hypothetical protein
MRGGEPEEHRPAAAARQIADGAPGDRRGDDGIDCEATLEDPEVFTQPWKIAYQIVRHRERSVESLEGGTLGRRQRAAPARRRAAGGQGGEGALHSHSEQ